MTWDRVERLLGSDALQHLRERRVAIVGLGSGGGFAAVSLAMSGVEHFVLIDDDVLDENNVVRHVADRRDIGRAKVAVVSDLIHQRNPAAEVTAVEGRFEDHEDLLDDVDLVISAVDGEGTKFMINELCIKKALTAVYAGVYERGEGGDVVLIPADSGPCYACWAAKLREGYISPAPDGSGELDYGLLNERGTLDAEPGLWLHVVRVAAAQADIALNFLLRGTPVFRQLPANTLLLANDALEIINGKMTPPHSAEWVEILRDPACMVCGETNRRSGGQGAISLDALAGDLVSFEEGESTDDG